MLARARSFKSARAHNLVKAGETTIFTSFGVSQPLTLDIPIASTLEEIDRRDSSSSSGKMAVRHGGLA